MDDTFAYCAALVRMFDHDRYLASLFAPPDGRNALAALYAFNAEVARAAEITSEPIAGEIRLQWWTEVIERQRNGEAAANPVAAALLATIDRYRLATAPLLGLIGATRRRLAPDGFPSIEALETYAAQTSSALIALAATVLGGSGEEAARPAGVAHGVTATLTAFPRDVARHRAAIPTELLERHGLDPNAVLAELSSPGLRAALADLRALARHRLAAARPLVTILSDVVLPAFLPVTLVRPTLDRLDRGDPSTAAPLSSWRRQWLIWRAARNPARITQ
jgi:phytoene synthase